MPEGRPPGRLAGLVRRATDGALARLEGAVDHLVATDDFAIVLTRSLGAALTAAAPMRRAAQQLAEHAADFANVPTRRQVAALTRRINHLERVLDDLDAKADALLAGQARRDGDRADG